jgi:hypothetical protein
MKNRISITVGTLAFVSLCVASLGHAQSLTMKAHVPFAFVAGKTQMPAGEYSVYRLLSSSVTLRDDTTKRTATVLTNSIQRSERNQKACLVFHRYGDAYILKEAWAGGQQIGSELPPSKVERELEAGSRQIMAEVRIPAR